MTEEEGVTEDCCDIVIVTWNALEVFKTCIESIKKHTGFDYRLIIVDNGSKQDMIDYLDTLKDEATIIYNGKNLGFGYASNQGARIGNSEYICFPK
jgi:GT2 family glycosyltransferase